MSEKSEAKSKGSSRREFIAAAGSAIAGLAVGAVIGSQAFPKTVELPGITRTETRTTTATVTAPGAVTTTTVTAPAATVTTTVAGAKTGWGFENIPYPDPPFHVLPRYDLCQGCGICEIECAYFHYGKINRRLSAIKITQYLTPIPKSFPTLCVQCNHDPDRNCEIACPVSPKAIYYDKKLMHMVVDKARCLGYKCAKCQIACGSGAIHFYPPSHDYAIVCDLCEKGGVAKPRCVEGCIAFALEVTSAPILPKLGETIPTTWPAPAYYSRIHPNEVAQEWAKRYPGLAKDKMGPW